MNSPHCVLHWTDLFICFVFLYLFKSLIPMEPNPLTSSYRERCMSNGRIRYCPTMTKISPPLFPPLIKLLWFYHSHPGLDLAEEHVCKGLFFLHTVSLFSKCTHATVCPFPRVDTRVHLGLFPSSVLHATLTPCCFVCFIPVVL